MEGKLKLSSCCQAPMKLGTELGDTYSVCTKCQKLVEKLDPKLPIVKGGIHPSVQQLRQFLNEEEIK